MKFFAMPFAIIFSFLLLNSCAPVRFTKSNTYNVNPNCTGANCSANQISCNPQINGGAASFTYSTGAALPSISSNCNPTTNVTYTWVAKRADASTIASTIPGLSGANPQSVNFQNLGPGSYYVYLTASQPGGTYSPYTATTPLEFIVPGSSGPRLSCSPKLNNTYTSMTIGPADNNPTVTANCSPNAATHQWTATKNGVSVSVPSLGGASSVPDFKALGNGEYKLSLYATLTNSPSWQSGTPLTVTVQGITTPPSGAIACTPRINGNLTSISLTASSPNPLISANCLPSTVQYNWNVTRNGVRVNVSGLAGSNSNPNFTSLGRGTYLVNLTATAPNFTTWTATHPLEITVDTTSPSLALNCSPRLNNTAVSVTITTAGPNPLVTSGCNPSSATHNWSVFKNGQSISVGNLVGPSSRPNFSGMGVGTYEIYLTATAPSYNAYASPSPLVVVVAQQPADYRIVNYNKTVEYDNNKVDLLVVFDDSRSMLPDSTKLAQRLQGFVNDLSSSNLDWQICSTTTSAYIRDGAYFWGASRNWINYVGSPQWVLKKGVNDPYSIFTATVNAIGAGWEDTDDERAIKAAYWSAEYALHNSCYRAGAAIAVIIISDEDERSIGGDPSQAFYPGELKHLEADDLPVQYINKIRQQFGRDKRVSVNSIIVRPGDSSCMATQDAAVQSDGTTSKSHYGFKYNELSLLTGGSVTSICANDYSSNLYYFRDRIISTQGSVPLECTPVGNIEVTITPLMASVSTSISNNTLYFNPAVPAGRTINLRYKCAQN